MQGYPNTIATRHDLEILLAEPESRNQALVYLQALMDERYNYRPDGSWGIVEPNGLTRLGLTADEAVDMGAVDRVVEEPTRVRPTLEEAQASAVQQIDAQAEAARLLVLTPGAGQMAAYQAKEAQAAAFLEDEAPTEAAYPDIYNEVDITADTAAGVADVIMQAAAAWRVYGRQIERTRLAAKRDIAAASSPEAVAAILAGVAWPAA